MPGVLAALQSGRDKVSRADSFASRFRALACARTRVHAHITCTHTPASIPPRRNTDIWLPATAESDTSPAAATCATIAVGRSTLASNISTRTQATTASSSSKIPCFGVTPPPIKLQPTPRNEPAPHNVVPWFEPAPGVAAASPQCVPKGGSESRTQATSTF